MSSAASPHTRFSWFTALKYAVYLLLMYNAFLFLQEELLALEHTYGGDLSEADLGQVFSATIDTVAWIVLLLLFELETSVIPDEQIRGWTKRALHGIRIGCYLFICYAFYGYINELLFLYQAVPVNVAATCAAGPAQWSLLVDLDDYQTLDAASCAQLGEGLVQLTVYQILALPDALQGARWLAWTDVWNAGAWLVVVFILEVDVRLQLRRSEEDWLIRFNRSIKLVLYGILLVAAIYWGYAGSFLDFWDAFLWLFAFVFIEKNVFDWQAEVKAEGQAEVSAH